MFRSSSGSFVPAALRIGRIAALGALCVCVCAGSRTVLAQDPPPDAAAAAQSGSARLETVSITGSQRFKSDQIAAAIGMKTGAMISRDDLQGDADKLAALGVFNSVKFKFSSERGGVRVYYEVTDGPGIPVVFDNFPWVSDDDLSAAIKASGALYDGTAPAKGTVLDPIADAIEKALDAHGIHARVSHTLVNDAATNQPVQQFRADDVSLTAGSIHFTDDLAAKDPGVQDRVPDLIDKPYSRTALELFVFEQVRPLYLNRAYLRVAFPPPSAKLPAGNTNPLDAKLDVTLAIVPGAQYKWSGVAWTGNNAVKSDELDKLVNLKPGDPVDGEKTGAINQRVESLYHSRGYLDFKLDLKPQYDEQAARVSYTAAVSEGPQYKMGKLVLTGLSTEGERRIRGGWSVPAGAMFDESLYQEFLDHGIKQAFVGLPVHYEHVGHFLEQDPQSGTVNVLLDFQ
jgi:outer membrane protein assembly factor BamA